MNHRGLIGSFLLLFLVVAAGMGLATWKYSSLEASAAASANQPEPVESVLVAVVRDFDHRPTTTSIGTVLALRSITLRNEVPGTVHAVRFSPGKVVEAGSVLVALDISVEEAELKAQIVQAVLAKKTLSRRLYLSQDLATSKEEVDRARTDLHVAQAQIARIKAIIAKKIIRAPFRARAGLADIHPGQYLNEGTQLTTLQGVDNAVHVDFAIPQQVAAGLHPGESVEVFSDTEASPASAEIVALDARIDSVTRNSMVRVKLDGVTGLPVPGAAVRVRVPVGPMRRAVAVPVSALRRGPGGDQVFVIAPDKNGKPRAKVRQVESGATFGDEVVIHAGLSAGERVAASGSFKLRDEVLVAIANDHKDEDRQSQIIGTL